MKADSEAYQNLSGTFYNLAKRSVQLEKSALVERHSRIQKEILDIATYLEKCVQLIEKAETKQMLFKPGKGSFSTYTNLNLVSQITKQSRYSYASVGYSYALKEANVGYTTDYFHIGARAKVLDTNFKSSLSARLWKKKKFDPRLVLKANASVSLFSASTSARLGTKNVYAQARASGQVGTAYANCKAVLSKKEQSFEAGIGVAALRGETRCVLNVFGAKVTLTAQGSIGSAEANFSYRFKEKEWEIGSKLGFIAGLGFKINVSY